MANPGSVIKFPISQLGWDKRNGSDSEKVPDTNGTNGTVVCFSTLARTQTARTTIYLLWAER